MLEVEQLASAQPESAVGAVEEIRRPPSVVQVDQDKQSDDFVMTTPNDVTHDVISLDGSDTDDAPEVISDSLCLLYTSPSPRDRTRSRMPSSA